jgi:hypothetical protein
MLVFFGILAVLYPLAFPVEAMCAQQDASPAGLKMVLEADKAELGMLEKFGLEKYGSEKAEDTLGQCSSHQGLWRTKD